MGNELKYLIKLKKSFENNIKLTLKLKGSKMHSHSQKIDALNHIQKTLLKNVFKDLFEEK